MYSVLYTVQGLGYGMLLVRFLVNIYYVVICAWCMVYLGNPSTYLNKQCLLLFRRKTGKRTFYLASRLQKNESCQYH
jgi:SNF family Na+-dependent transporter